jgi:flagellin-like hook-associated protein FlgL
MSASYSALNMKRANSLLTKSLQRLSSGKRIVSPADDAGGLAVGLKLQSSMRRAAASMMNTQNGMSFLQMQDGAMKVAGEIVDRMAELKAFFNDISKNALDRETYNHEFHELQKELNSLKAQKFNGVSLFAMTEPDNNPLKIITSDDGLGEKIELARTGFFENLKSKFGADGTLNSGSQGSYRQLVGNFTEDGGILDADPGHTSRAYASGDVVYKQGVSLSDSGYFMALKDVAAGTAINDSYDSLSSWIRVADKGGDGFAESFPTAGEYSQYNTQRNSDGEVMAYLKGDVIKVPAHWSSPGSYLYMEAQTDVPQGLTLSELFDSYVGSGGYFDYVGQDRSNGAAAGGKPTTDFVRANGNLAEPDTHIAGDIPSLVSLMAVADSPNNYTPGFVKVGNDIYEANHDWGVKTWNSKNSFKEGDLFFDSANSKVKYVTSNVKGTYTGATAVEGEFVTYQGEWYKSASIAALSQVPPSLTNAVSLSTTTIHKAGDIIKYREAGNNVSLYTLFTASSILKGANSSSNRASAVAGDILASIHSDNTVKYYSVDAGANLSGSAATTLVSLATAGLVSVTTVPTTGLSSSNNGNSVWGRSPWQAIVKPELDADFADDITSQLADETNTSYWSKTHYGSLDGSTVNTSYTRGDNIYYQGKHYVYTSHLDSNDPLYADPTNSGYTEFERLLELQAITELSMYVDTVGGGGNSNLPDGVYYRPNQSLDFVDRLPNSGTVRTNSIERRTDAPLPPGDEIYNSQDDQFYGGLNAGNDGIYGTMDDFYSTTAYSDTAKAGGHVDADADNNMNLLDTTKGLEDFSVADFVDYIQTIANFRAVNGGTQSRLGYATRILEENQINLQAATSRIMDADMAAESTKLAQQNVLIQAGASMVVQANQQASLVLSLLQ